jgi:predicted kinase
VNDVHVLVLHGSPGSGKSTLSRAIAELLRSADVANAVIDLDELSLIHPHPGRSFARDNLRAVWPNFVAVPHLKVVLPMVVADEEELGQLRAVVPCSAFVVCELTAPAAVLKDRVTAREPNEFWQGRLQNFVDLYHRRTDLARIRDFQVTTHGRSVDDAAQEVIEKAGWSVWPVTASAETPVDPGREEVSARGCRDAKSAGKHIDLPRYARHYP